MDRKLYLSLSKQKKILNYFSQGVISLNFAHLKVKHLVSASNWGSVCSQWR